MKILLINLWRVINSKGGAEKVLFDMANALSERGHEVTILALENKQGEPFFAISDKVSFINVGLNFKKYDNIFQRIKRALISNKKKRELYNEELFDTKRAERMRPVIEGTDWDCIISYNIEATRILKFKLNVTKPIITMFHFDVNTLFSGMPEHSRMALEDCDCIQVLLPSFVEKTKASIKNTEVVCIPNVVFPFTGSAVKENVIVNVGRVCKDKGQHLLIEAFNKIKEKYPEWRVEIWGETDFSPVFAKYCQALINKNGLVGRVKICGTTANIAEKLAKAKIFAFPSDHEGFGLALSEAMSAGLPVIGFKNAPGVNEMIKNAETGLLCDDGIAALSAALEKLINDEDLRNKLGTAAKEDMKQYAPDIVWDKWEALIYRISKRNN